MQEQPDSTEIISIISDAKQYHREVLVKLIQAGATVDSLSTMLHMLQGLDEVVARLGMPIDRANNFEERMSLLEEAFERTLRDGKVQGRMARSLSDIASVEPRLSRISK